MPESGNVQHSDLDYTSFLRLQSGGANFIRLERTRDLPAPYKDKMAKPASAIYLLAEPVSADKCVAIKHAMESAMREIGEKDGTPVPDIKEVVTETGVGLVIRELALARLLEKHDPEKLAQAEVPLVEKQRSPQYMIEEICRAEYDNHNGEDLRGFALVPWARDVLRWEIIPQLSGASQNLTVLLLNYAKLAEIVDKKPDKALSASLLEPWQKTAIGAIDKGRFDHRSLANSLYAFGKLGIRPSPEFMSAWQKSALSKIEEFSPIDISSSIYAFGKLGIQPSPEFMTAWQKVAIAKIDEFDSKHLSSSLYALGRLEIQPPSDFLAAWQKVAIKKIEAFGPQELSNSVHAFYTVGSQPLPELLAAWQKVATRTIDGFNSQALSNSLHALGKLDIRPTPEFMTAWQKAATGKIEKFKPQELSNSLYAFYKIGIQPSPEFLAAWQKAATDKIREFNPLDVSSSIYAFGKLGIQPSPEFLAVWQKAAISKMGELNSQELSNSFYALGKLGIKPSPEFLADWQKTAIGKIGEFTPQALSGSFYAVGKLGIKPSPEFLAAWQKAAISKIGEFDTLDISSSMYAFGRLGIQPSPEFLAVWQKVATGKIEEFDPQSLANGIYAFSRLRVQPPQVFQTLWQKTAISKIGEFSPQNLSNSLYALGVLGIQPSQEFLAAWHKAAVGKIKEFDPQNIANSLYSLAVIGALSKEAPGLPEDFMKEVNARVKDFSEIHVHQLYLASQFFRNGEPVFDIDEAQLLRNKNNKAGIISRTEEAITESLKSSAVIKELERDGITMHPGAFVDAIASHVDICFECKGKPVFVVQVDGPSHYVRDTNDKLLLDGQGMLQSAILERNNIPVIRFDGKSHTKELVLKIREITAYIARQKGPSPSVKQP